MSDTAKDMLLCFIVFILWSGFCFGSGYLLCNRNATKRIEQSNNELREQQQKYDELISLTDERIREANERIRNIREELQREISNSNETSGKLSAIIEVIRQQKLDI